MSGRGINNNGLKLKGKSKMEMERVTTYLSRFSIPFTCEPENLTIEILQEPKF